jgi:hypothetical protein
VFSVGVRWPIALACAAALAACLPAAALAQEHTVVWAVGDAQAHDEATQDAVATRIQAEGGFQRLLMLGDLTDGGTAEEYQNLYIPSYGRFKDITSPTIGNHDWDRRDEGYDAYWGPGVRQPDGGHWYSFDLGGWHFVSLSSMEDRGPSSPQVAWLRQDLARYPGTCTIAFTHFPRYSAGPQFNSTSLEPFWQALRGHGILFLSGHAHNYQRHFPVRGITQFVVGTGGGQLGNTDDFDPRLAAKTDSYHGALRLELGVGGARFRFVEVNGATLDQGGLTCVPHAPTPAAITTQRPRNRTRYRAVRTLFGRVSNAMRIRLTLVRRAGRGCLAFDGERFRGASCQTRLSFPVATVKPPAFPGAGIYRWRHSLPSATTLPPGRYRLDVRVRALDRSLAKRSTRFTIRR